MNAPKPHQLKPGLEVQLGEHGPPMVVTDVGMHTGLVLCRWLGGEGAFPASSLFVYEPPLTYTTSPAAVFGDVKSRRPLSVESR